MELSELRSRRMPPSPNAESRLPSEPMRKSAAVGDAAPVTEPATKTSPLSGAAFFASVDIRPVEKKVERLSRDALAKADGGESNNLDARLRKIESEGQRMLDGRLKGLDLSLKTVGSGDNQRVKALIQPNYYEWEVDEVGGDWDELKAEIDKRKGHKGRYNAELAFLQQLGDRFHAKVTYEQQGDGRNEDFAWLVEVTFAKDGKRLVVWMHRFDTGAGKHEFQDAANPGVCALTGRPLATTTNPTTGQLEGDAGKRTRPHDALSAGDWADAIADSGAAVLGADPDVVAFLARLASRAADTKSFMVGDGRSSRSHEYVKEGNTVPNQEVESLHGDKSMGERQRMADDPSRTVPGQSDDVFVEIDTRGGPRAIMPKKDLRGDEWAGMSKDESNAALLARIRISITGLQGGALRPRPGPGLDQSLLPAFWAALEIAAYRRGRW
jgi:hypothetical protein